MQASCAVAPRTLGKSCNALTPLAHVPIEYEPWTKWLTGLEATLQPCMYRSSANYSISLIFNHQDLLFFLRSLQMKWHKIDMNVCVVLSPTHF